MNNNECDLPFFMITITLTFTKKQKVPNIDYIFNILMIPKAEPIAKSRDSISWNISPKSQIYIENLTWISNYLEGLVNINRITSSKIEDDYL